jgi:hypothetical protein
MRHILVVLTRPIGSLNQAVIQELHGVVESETEVFDLTGNEHDYRRLLEAIFRADSIQTW